MDLDAHQLLSLIIEYCHVKLVEAEMEPSRLNESQEMRNGRKSAYDEVLAYVSTLL